jgi:hypothetical protein
MPKHNKGKPGGKFAESKKDAGRKGDYKRGGWPEDAATQRVEDNEGQNASELEDDARGRNRKAGSPV